MSKHAPKIKVVGSVVGGWRDGRDRNWVLVLGAASITAM
jgi:hypothetical protein